MTAFGELETAVEAMSAGRVLVRQEAVPERGAARAGRARARVAEALARAAGASATRRSPTRTSSTRPRPSMQEAYAIAEQVARGDTTSVLIEGESGTGKEYFANLIHRMSARHDKPFVEINCAAIPQRAARERAVRPREGRLHRRARAEARPAWSWRNGGTLFLDEIGEMSPMLQVKLLRVLERRDLQARRRHQGHHGQRAHHLGHQPGPRAHGAARAAFREDLYYRLKVVPLYVPPLRERKEDILPLARLLHGALRRGSSRRRSATSRPRPSACCCDYPWPGNIRELRNLFERTVLLETGRGARAASPQARAAHARPAPRRRSASAWTSYLTGALPDGRHSVRGVWSRSWSAP